MNNKSEVTKFCKEHHITENQFYGKEKIQGNLDLRSVKSLPDGFNPTVRGWLYLHSVETLPSGFNPTVGGNLWLNSVKTLPAGFNPTVGEILDLSSVEKLPYGFNPTVGGSLNLRSVKSLPAGFNNTVGGSLDLRSVEELPTCFNTTVGGYLWLGSVKTLPTCFNPTVGCGLDLNSVEELPVGFNPTVGGYLNLSSVKELPSDFNPTVGGSIYTKYGSKYIYNLPNNFIFSWQNGRYIKVDGIFAEVIKKRGNIYHTKLIGKDDILYLVTDGNGTWAHGSTLSEAKEDLIYKKTSRNKDDYNSLTLDSELTFQEAVTCYRVITGACAAGVRNFVEMKLTNNNSKCKDAKFTVKEIIDMTVGEYGHDAFECFFHK